MLSSRGTVNARRLFLDSASIFGLVVAVASITWVVSSERNRLDSKIDNLTNAFQNFTYTYSLAVRNRFTRDEHSKWCRQAERLNKGWTCPELDPPTVDDMERYNFDENKSR